MSRTRECTRRGLGAGGGRGGRVLALALALAVMLGACAPVESLPELGEAERRPGPGGEARGLAAGPGDTLWALSGDTLWSFVPGEEPRARGSFPRSARLLWSGPERIYLAAGGRVHAFAPENDSVRAVSRVTGSAAALDPRGRHLLLGGARGEVYGLGPRALLTSWAWPRLGARSAALAVSFEGSRVYHSLHANGEPAASRLLTRDFQTGRVLGEIELRGWTGWMGIGEGGELFLLQLRVDGADLVALRPLGGRMLPLWRRETEEVGLTGEVQVVVSGERLWVGEAGTGRGVVLERATGDKVARTHFPPGGRALAGPGGSVWVLAPGELLRYELEAVP